MLHEVVDAEYVRYPGWPESRYLVKIAAEAPDEVATTIVEMTPTGNAQVHGDLLEAALAMPADSAARIAPLACESIEDSFLLVGDRASQLVAKLAEAGEVEAASRLAKSILALREVPAEFDLGYGALFEVKARVDDWEYQQFLQRHFSHLLTADPQGAIRILRNALIQALVLERKRWQTDRDDGMKMVRDRIEKHEEYPPVDNALITTLRDALVSELRERPEEAVGTLALIADKPYLVFRRLELHALAEVPIDELRDLRDCSLLDPSLSLITQLSTNTNGYSSVCVLFAQIYLSFSRSWWRA